VTAETVGAALVDVVEAQDRWRAAAEAADHALIAWHDGCETIDGVEQAAQTEHERFLEYLAASRALERNANNGDGPIPFVLTSVGVLELVAGELEGLAETSRGLGGDAVAVGDAYGIAAALIRARVVEFSDRLCR